MRISLAVLFLFVISSASFAGDVKSEGLKRLLKSGDVELSANASGGAAVQVVPAPEKISAGGPGTDYTGATYDSSGNQVGTVTFTDNGGNTTSQDFSGAKYDSNGNQVGVIVSTDAQGRTTKQDYSKAQYDAKGNQTGVLHTQDLPGVESLPSTAKVRHDSRGPRVVAVTPGDGAASVNFVSVDFTDRGQIIK